MKPYTNDNGKKSIILINFIIAAQFFDKDKKKNDMDGKSANEKK